MCTIVVLVQTSTTELRCKEREEKREKDHDFFLRRFRGRFTFDSPLTNQKIQYFSTPAAAKIMTNLSPNKQILGLTQ